MYNEDDSTIARSDAHVELSADGLANYEICEPENAHDDDIARFEDEGGPCAE